MTYGGAALSLFRPYSGFLIYVCFAIIKPDQLWSWSVPPGNYSRIVAVALLVGWGLNGFGKWNLGRARGIVLCLIGFWAVLLLGAITARDQDLGWQTVEPMSKTFLPILVGISLINSWAQLRQLAWVIVLSQGFLAYEFNLNYYTTFFLPQEFYHGGLDNNSIAITMVTSIGVAFFLGMHAQKWWQRAIAFGCAGLMAHVVLFSDSRGGMVALIITAAACFLLIQKTTRSYVILVLAVLVVGRLAGEGVQKRFGTIFQTSEEFKTEEEARAKGVDAGGRRLQHWKACLDSMSKRPLGVGPNHWPITAPEYGLPEMAGHSTWLQVGAELGIPGLAFLAGYYLLCIGRLWPYTRERTHVTNPWTRYLARMVIASLVGFLVSAQFVTVDGVELPYYIVLIGAGTLKVMALDPAEVQPEKVRNKAAEMSVEAAIA
jgi:O-antigen ligase